MAKIATELAGKCHEVQMISVSVLYAVISIIVWIIIIILKG